MTKDREVGFRPDAGEHRNRQIKWKDMDPTRFFFLNAAANFVADAAIYPIDVIRTRMQVQGSSAIKASFPCYKNSLDALVKIVKAEGPRGLFKGFMISEGGYVAGHTVYYGVYEVLKQGLQTMYPCYSSKESTMNVFWTTAVAGGVADLVACGLSVPSEVATTRLQIQGPLARAKYKGGLDVLTRVYRMEGIRGLYRGLGATLLRNVPNSAMWWGSYEVTKNKLHAFDLRAKLGLPSRKSADPHSRVENEDPLVHIVAGVVAAVVATTIVNPIDVAKTRLQSTEYVPHSPSPVTPITATRKTPQNSVATPIATSGTPIAMSGKPIATPVTPTATSGTPIATSGKPIATSGTPIATSGKPIATPGPIATSGSTKPPRPSTTPTNPILANHTATNLSTHAFAITPARAIATNQTKTPVPIGSIPFALVKGLFFGKHNTITVLMTMLREEGIKSFGKGLFPSLLIATPYSVLSILLYEEIKKWCVVN